MCPTKKVSVIIPCYNVPEEDFEHCIQSVINQSYSNLEIIIIDDGSEKTAAAILDTWASKDGRIHVFHQSNHGVSSARNRGLDYATGEYIGFIDADDCIHPQMYERMVSVLQQYSDVDIAVCNYCRILPGKPVPPQVYNNLPQVDVYAGDKALYCLFSQSCEGFLCNKLYRKNILDGKKLNTDLVLCEDLEYNFRLLYRNGKSIACISEPLYYYVENPASASQASHRMLRRDGIPHVLYAYDIMQQQIDKENGIEFQRFLKDKRNVVQLLILPKLCETDSDMYIRYRQELLDSHVFKKNREKLSQKQRALIVLSLYFPNLYRSIRKLYVKLKWGSDGN